MKKTFFEHSQGFACGAIMMSIMLVVFDATPNKINKKWQNDAVTHHAAEWIVDNNGEVSFQWKNTPKAITVSEVENTTSLLLPDETMEHSGKEN
jgi:hypothetical protein